MNLWLNGARTPNDPAFPPDWRVPDPLHLVKSKLPQLVQPRPSGVFVFMEENEQSIEDGYMRVQNPKYGPYPAEDNWYALPSDRHGTGCNATFADHHIEHLKWNYPKRFASHGQPSAGRPDQQDFLRLISYVPIQ
jgi:hypothetical protein